MSNSESVLQALVEMSRKLGRPERDLVILGEGNTSALCDDGTFWVKASGAQLPSIEASGFVHMNLDAVCALVDLDGLSDDQLKAALEAAKTDPSKLARPSTEVAFHALALTEGGARFVGHTHPVAVNALACSVALPEAISGRLFPDEIVVCGPAPVYVPYVDPGLPLSKAIRSALRSYANEWGRLPKVVLMQNHGLIALGDSPEEVDNITAMFVKTCRILAGAYAFGGPHFLSEKQAERIHTRPDEAYRRERLQIS